MRAEAKCAIACLLLAATVWAGACARPSSAGRPSQVPFRTAEDTTTRESFRAYLRTHVADIKRTLVSTETGYPLMSSAEASASELSSPELVWLYDPSRVPVGASPWRGLVRVGQHEYVLSVISGGKARATLKIWDMPHYWVPFIDRDRALIEPARAQLDRYFGSTDYEFAYVEQGGVWGLGRRGDQMAGVLVAPWGESHRTGTPKGVQTGGQHVWWLAHPIGR